MSCLKDQKFLSLYTYCVLNNTVNNGFILIGDKNIVFLHNGKSKGTSIPFVYKMMMIIFLFQGESMGLANEI